MLLVSFVSPVEDKNMIGALVGPVSAGGKLKILPGEVLDIPGAGSSGEGAGSSGEASGTGRVFLLDLVRYGRTAGEKLPCNLREILDRKMLPTLKRLLKKYRADCRSGAKRINRYLISPGDVKVLPPITDPKKIILVGKNYIDHCNEGSASIPDRPVIFSKFVTSLNGSGCDIVLPKASSKVDFEAELALVIGRGGRNITSEKALRHVAGYMPLNDVSARDLQFREGQWVRAKSCDTFCPCGPALVTSDHVKDPQDLDIKLYLNGELMQDSNTSCMIFPVCRLIEFVSEVITLEPGDIISTGTPSGVGAFRDPPVFLKKGDETKIVIEKIGVLKNTVVEEKGRNVKKRQERMKRVFD